MGTITNSAKQQAVDLAKQIAKDFSEEPGEIMKDTKEQITGIDNASQDQTQAPTEQVSMEEKRKIDIQGQRQLQALESEIKDIQLQKAKEEEMKERIELQEKASEEQKSVLPVPSSKPGRKFGMPQKAKQQQTRIEKPLPPTG